MGVVYKAQDLKLDRDVALKSLSRGSETHDFARTRFSQEAQAVSVLNHPDVCAIYDIEEEVGQHFIVMQYVDGKTLRQLVPILKIQDAIT